MILRVFGLEIEISFLFCAVMVLILATDKTGNIEYFFLGAAIHEAAHLAAMFFLGYKPSAIRFVVGGINIEEVLPKTRLEDAVILFAGPVANLICFLIFGDLFAAVNLLMFIYNMLPLTNLDGGRLIILALNKRLRMKTIRRIMTVLTVAIAAIIICVFALLARNGNLNYTLPIFALYLISGLAIFKKGIERET